MRSIRCPGCHGEGWNPCTKCSASEDEVEGCECGGSGRIPCGDCKEEGRIDVVDLAKFEDAIEAIKLAYRYVHLADDDIGSNELSDTLAVALQEHMGDDGFQRWVKEVSPWDDDEDEDDGQ